MKLQCRSPSLGLKTGKEVADENDVTELDIDEIVKIV